LEASANFAVALGYVKGKLPMRVALKLLLPNMMPFHLGFLLWRQPPDFAFVLATLHQRHFTVMPLT